MVNSKVFICIFRTASFEIRAMIKVWTMNRKQNELKRKWIFWLYGSIQAIWFDGCARNAYRIKAKQMKSIWLALRIYFVIVYSEICLIFFPSHLSCQCHCLALSSKLCFYFQFGILSGEPKIKAKCSTNIWWAKFQESKKKKNIDKSAKAQIIYNAFHNSQCSCSENDAHFGLSDGWISS